MRVFAICQRSWRGVGPSGGAETMMADLVEHLAAKGWDADAVFISKTRDKTDVNGVSVYRRRSLDDFDDLTRNADVIMTHLGATPMAKRAGKKYSKPVVQLVHNTNEFTIGFLGSGCDMAVYNAEWVRDLHDSVREQKVIQVWDSKRSASFRVRSTTEWDSVLVRPPVMEDRILSNPDGQYITLVNLVPNKGPDVFYKLAEMNPDLKFMGVIGGYEENHQVIQKKNNVFIAPHTANQHEFYSQTKVLLCPSIYESYGRVGIEAARYGIPTIASPTPGLRESLAYSGKFAERDDIDAWNAELHRVLDNYDAHSSLAYQRWDELKRQTPSDLKNFEEAMVRVGNGNHRD